MVESTCVGWSLVFDVEAYTTNPNENTTVCVAEWGVKLTFGGASPETNNVIVVTSAFDDSSAECRHYPVGVVA